MGSVLLAGADGHEEAGIALQRGPHLVRNEGLQVQRIAHLVVAGCLAAVAAAEWLHGGAPAWAWASAAVGLAAAALVAPRPSRSAAAGWLRALRARRLASWARVLAALACLALGAVQLAGLFQARRIECCWTDLLGRRIAADSADLKAALGQAVAAARRLAERGRTAALLPAEAQFAPLASALAAGWLPAIERGVMVLGADGEPQAWAGRHRFVPARDTAELRSVITPFYVSLEARRQTRDGGTAVGTVLLHAAPAAAGGGGALSEAFARAHEVTLRFYPPSAAPPGRWRWVVVVAAAWALARAPLGPYLRPATLFSPAAFYRPLLGVFSASAGSLAVFSLVLLLGAGLVWRRGIGRRWWTVGPALLLVLEAPYLVRYLGRGIAPPARGVSLPVWLSWEAALALASMALVLVAAALVRGREEPQHVRWTLPAACGWAALAAVAGLWLWQPYGAWPEWYTFVWLPALLGAIVPAPRRWAVAGIAVVAGTAAALVTWGAAVEGRLALAARDARGSARKATPSRWPGWSAWLIRLRRRRPRAPRATCTHSGSPPRSRDRTIPRPSACGRPAGCRAPSCASLRSTCPRRSSPRWCAPRRPRAAPGWSGWSASRECTTCWLRRSHRGTSSPWGWVRRRASFPPIAWRRSSRASRRSRRGTPSRSPHRG